MLIKHIGYITILIFTFTTVVIAAPPKKKDLIGKAEIEKIEKEVQAIIAKEKVPDEKLFYLYMLGARNLRKHGLNELAYKYYIKAFELKVEFNQNRLQGMLELAWLYVTQKNWQALAPFNQQLRQYSEQYGFLKSIKTLPYTLDYFDVVATDKTVKEAIGKDYSYFFDTNYNNMIIDRELEINMQRGNFDVARAMFKFKTFDQYTYYQYLVTFDLLNTLTAKSQENFVCAERATNAEGLEVEICRALMHFQKSKKANQRNFPQLAARAKKKAGLEFLAPALEAIAKL